mgnify:FL=1
MVSLSTLVFGQNPDVVNKFVVNEIVKEYDGGYIQNSIKAKENVYLSTLVVGKYTDFNDVSYNTRVFVNRYSDIQVIESWSMYEDSDGDSFFQIVLDMEETPYVIVLQYYQYYEFMLIYTINTENENKSQYT